MKTSLRVTGHVLETNDWVEFVCFSTNEKLLAACSANSIELFDIGSFERVLTLIHDSIVWKCCFGTVETGCLGSLYSVTSDGFVHVWNIDESSGGKLLHSVKVHRDCAFACDLHPHLPVLVTAGADQEVNLILLQVYELPLVVSTLRRHVKSVEDVKFSSCGRYMASCSKDTVIRVWDLSEAKFIQRSREVAMTTTDSPATLSAITEISASDVTLPEMSSAHSTPSRQSSMSETVPEDCHSMSSFSSLSSDSLLLTESRMEYDNDPAEMDGHQSNNAAAPETPPSQQIQQNHNSNSNGDAFLPSLEASGSSYSDMEEASVKDYNLASITSSLSETSISERASIKDYNIGSSYSSPYMPNDGFTLATLILAKTLGGLDIPHTDLKKHQGWVLSLDFSPGGEMLVSSATDKTIMLWCVTACTLLRVFHGHTGIVWHVHFLRVPCGHPQDYSGPEHQDVIVSCSSDKTLRVWEPVKAKQLHCERYLDGQKDGRAQLLSCAYASHHQLLAVGSHAGKIHLARLLAY